MLFRINSRGWISDSDSGANASYYFYSGMWFGILSPHHSWSSNHASFIGVRSGGDLHGYGVDKLGGVQNFIKN